MLQSSMHIKTFVDLDYPGSLQITRLRGDSDMPNKKPGGACKTDTARRETRRSERDYFFMPVFSFHSAMDFSFMRT